MFFKARRQIVSATSLWLFILAFKVIAAEGEKSLTAAELIQKIVENEKGTRQIEIGHFVGRAYTGTVDGPLTAIPRVVEGSAAYDGLLGGRFAVKYAHNVMGHRDSTKPWLDTSGGDSYDGTSGRTIHGTVSTVSSDKKSQKSPTAEIRSAWIKPFSPRGEALSFEGFCDSSLASLGYFPSYVRVKDSPSQLLGDSLSTMLKQQGRFVVASEPVDGVDAVKLVDPAGNSYWFDINRGYALIRAKGKAITYSVAPPYDTLVVQQLEKMGTGLWYPVKGYWEGIIEEGNGKKRKERVEFQASDVKSEPGMSLDFQLPIPGGYKVYDQIKNETYVSAGTPEELKDKLDHVKEDASKLIGELPPVTETMVSEPTGDRSYAKWVIAGGVLMVLVAVIGFVFLRKHRTQA